MNGWVLPRVLRAGGVSWLWLRVVCAVARRRRVAAAELLCARVSSDAVLYHARTLRAAKPAKTIVLTQWYCIRTARHHFAAGRRLPGLLGIPSVLLTASLLLS